MSFPRTLMILALTGAAVHTLPTAAMDAFASADSDRNTMISPSEFELWFRAGRHTYPHPKRLFEALDADQSGALSREEFAQLEARMERLQRTRGGPPHG